MKCAWVSILVLLLAGCGGDSHLTTSAELEVDLGIAAESGGWVNNADYLFYCHDEEAGPLVPYRDEVFESRNIAHIGDENSPLEMVILLGEPDAPAEECTQIRIYEQQIPGRHRTIAEAVWIIMDGKMSSPFSNRPMEQRYTSITTGHDPVHGYHPWPGMKMADIERHIFIEHLGLEMQGPDWWTAGKMRIGELGEPVTKVFRFLHADEFVRSAN